METYIITVSITISGAALGWAMYVVRRLSRIEGKLDMIVRYINDPKESEVKKDA